MKKTILGTLMATALFGASAFAVTPEEAREFFQKRDQGIEWSLKAADAYKSLATSSSRSEVEKASFKINEAEALYFHIGLIPDGRSNKKEKLEKYERAYNAAISGAGVLASAPGVAKKPEFKTELARAYYWYSANLGKWGETKGVLASLGRWGELKEHVNYALKLDKTVEDYGPNRIFSRAYLKVPFESNDEALAFAKEAYKNTLTTVSGIEMSRHTTTVLYYLNALEDRRQTDTFCEVFDNFSDLSRLSDAELLQYNPKRLPETKADIKEFENDSDLNEYYDDNC